MNRARGVADPRPDLRRDSRLWSRLLALAWGPSADCPAGVWGPLHGMRCYGVALVVTDKGIALGRGEMTEAEYQADRARYLMPHKDELIRLLQELGKWRRSSVIPARVHGRASEQATA